MMIEDDPEIGMVDDYVGPQIVSVFIVAIFLTAISLLIVVLA